MKWQPIITTDSMRVISQIDQKNQEILITEKDTTMYIMKSINVEEMLILENLKEEIVGLLNNDFYKMIEDSYQLASSMGGYYTVYFI